ncbi:hypothetical protein CROQUDRAFT_90030 [Cronartium quercuum f. sp. fusiforme G11]|uniref:Uncharacterized protein n=1 Tax=Cronartium quercuum f. sp. fusiforme G11 TaxID=708437 RepID=A0A9P6NMI7_9BASI|nr:hypothetical protein CROQUDRAFT_90030 [Cronartium quercuum f. sp. fusiforme G11]
MLYVVLMPTILFHLVGSLSLINSLPSQFKIPINKFVNLNGAPVFMGFDARPFERQLFNCNASI